MNEVRLLGVKLDHISNDQAISKMVDFLSDKNKQHLIVTVNAEFIVQAQRDERFKLILNQASLNLVDSYGVRLMARLFLKNNLYRFTGADFFWPSIKESIKLKKTIYLLGGKQDSVIKSIALVKERYPEANIFGQVGPYFTLNGDKIVFTKNEEVINNSVIEEINKIKPDIIFVGFGAPKQEYWLAEFLSKCSSVKVGIGVGGTFDFISGNIKRAPFFLRALGLEWLWRFIIEPWRYKRMFNALIKFPLLCFNYYIIKKLHD